MADFDLRGSPRVYKAAALPLSYAGILSEGQRKPFVFAYIGDGSNRWPIVHRLDAAHLVCMAVEKAPAGSVLHAVADKGVPIRTIAETIGPHLDLPISPEDAREHFVWLARLLALDAPASSTLTSELLRWQPTNPGLIEDLDSGQYFRG